MRPTMKPPLHMKWFVILLFCLASIAYLRVEASISPSQPRQDPNRRIKSNDFIEGRKEVASPSRKRKSRVQTKRPTYRLVSNPAVGPRQRAGNFKQLGITIWRLRPARTGD